MRTKENKAATSAEATAFKFVRQNQSYIKSFPIAKKFDYLLGIALLSLQNPENNPQSQKELLNVIKNLLVLKADLGLLGGIK